MGTSNGLNDFNVNALKSCGLNFSENTQGLKEPGQRTLSPGGICFLFPFCVPMSVVIVAETEACQKRFKMAFSVPGCSAESMKGSKSGMVGRR